MPCIMIVDDDLLQRRQLEAMMLKMGHRCVVVAGGQEALEYLAGNRQPAPEGKTTPVIHLMDQEGNLRSLEDIESEIIDFALNHCKTSRSDIARMLGIGRTTLYRKAHQLYA